LQAIFRYTLGMMSEHAARETREQPKCVAIVLCNEVIEDKRTNNKTLVSLFNTTVVDQLPSFQPRMFIMASLTNGLGHWPLTVRIINPSNVEVLRINGEVAFDDPLVVLDVVMEVRMLPLDEAGVYLLMCWLALRLSPNAAFWCNWRTLGYSNLRLTQQSRSVSF
jgi:hypothetical protein